MIIKNYLTVGWRTLLKNKVYSIVNISGLAIGLACAMAIGLFIADEYSYDRFHANAENIYRVVQTQNQAGELYDVACSPAPMGAALKTDFPEVIDHCLIGYRHSGTLQHGSTTIVVPNITRANSGFFSVFDFELLRGNDDEAFSRPDQIVITEKIAERLFGSGWATNEGLVGSTIIYNKSTPLMISGVIREAPVNSHIQFDAIVAFDASNRDDQNWFSNNFHTYVQLAEGTTKESFDLKLHDYIEKYRDPASPFRSPVFFLQPLTDIYLHSAFDFQTDWSKTSSIVYVQVFFAVGLVVLTIAVFNFINLSTARASRRAKEVGVRKTIGAHYRQLMTQFLLESVLITSIAVVLAMGIVQVALPLLNELAGKTLYLPIQNIPFISIVIVFTSAVGIFAGIYPAVYLSSFKPARVLKGLFDVRSGRRFRQVLVVTQFTLTIVLVAASIVIHEQLSFVRDKDLGFDKSQLIYLGTGDMKREIAALLRDDLKQRASISGASLASNSLVDVIHSTMGFDWEGKSADDGFLITRFNVDPGYLETAGMRLVSGRNFEEGRKADSASFIINQTAAKRMGWTSGDALGKSFSIQGVQGTIIGVVADFHFRPMTAAIEPAVFMNISRYYYGGMLIRGRSTHAAIADIESTYKKYEPGIPANYRFVDEQLDRQYKLEQVSSQLVLIFSLLAILVACLGLYGLANFTAERRTKEIGIRKVMGASVFGVTHLLSKDFLSMVVLSIVIASPIGFVLMQQWLSGFVYRIELQWTFFALAGLLSLLIAALTVGYQAAVAARMNPVNSLRTE